MSWVDSDAYGAAEVDPIAHAAEEILAHMNQDHADANLQYVRHLAGLTEASAAALTGVDRYGLTLQATTPSGPRLARVAFSKPLQGAGDARGATIELLQRADAADPLTR